jgi:hypothetical protein
VFDKWLQRQRVSKAHVSKHGGVSPNTLNYISQGTTAHPEMETLRKMAWGLATDPHSLAVDGGVYRRAWSDLAAAGGHPEPSLEAPASSVEESIGTIARHPGSPAEWAEFIRDYPDATPDQIRGLRALYENLKRSGMIRLEHPE